MNGCGWETLCRIFLNEWARKPLQEVILNEWVLGSCFVFEVGCYGESQSQSEQGHNSKLHQEEREGYSALTQDWTYEPEPLSVAQKLLGSISREDIKDSTLIHSLLTHSLTHALLHQRHHVRYNILYMQS